MRDLYKLTAAEAMSYAIDRVLESNPEVTKKQAKELVLNALVYNCVIEEIVGQVNFLLEKEEI